MGARSSSNEELDEDIEMMLDVVFENDGDMINDSAPVRVGQFEFGTDYIADIIPNIGDEIAIYWPMASQYYSMRSVIRENDHYVVQYDESNVEELDLTTETWRSCRGNVIGGAPVLVTSNAQQTCSSKLHYLDSSSFLGDQAQGVALPVRADAYEI